MKSIKAWVPFVLAVLTSAVVAFGQSGVVNQGKPGSYGPWPVSVTGTITTTSTCGTPTNKVTTVGTVAVICPPAQLVGRRFVLFCNSKENTGTPKIKIRIDGTAPVMGATSPGDVLGLGDCVQYTIPAATTPQCISDTAGTALTSVECS